MHNLKSNLKDNLKGNAMNKLKSKLITKFSLAVVVLSMTFSAWAITLEQAKQQGLVGEMPNGFLGIVVTNTEVASLVASVNKKRKTIYLDLARKNNLTVQQVTKLAGEKAIKKTSSGHLIKNASGNWVKK